MRFIFGLSLGLLFFAPLALARTHQCPNPKSGRDRPIATLLDCTIYHRGATETEEQDKWIGDSAIPLYDLNDEWSMWTRSQDGYVSLNIYKDETSDELSTRLYLDVADPLCLGVGTRTHTRIVDITKIMTSAELTCGEQVYTAVCSSDNGC